MRENRSDAGALFFDEKGGLKGTILTEEKGEAMRYKCRKITIGFIVAVAISLIMAGAGVFDGSTAWADDDETTSAVTDADGNPVGQSTLEREDDEIELEFEAINLIPGNVYSVWMFPGTALIWGTAFIASDDSEEIEIELEVGETGGEGDRPCCRGTFEDPFDAIRALMLNHGEASEDLDVLMLQLTIPTGGCEDDEGEPENCPVHLRVSEHPAVDGDEDEDEDD